MEVGLFALIHSKQGGSAGFLLPLAVLFVLSFWASTFIANGVRAALTAPLAMFGLFVTVFLAQVCSEEFTKGVLFDGLMRWILIHYQYPPEFVYKFQSDPTVLFLILGGALIIALIQSLRQFRRGQNQHRAFWRSSVILAGFVFSVSLLSFEFQHSVLNIYNSPMVREVATAVQTLNVSDYELTTSGRDIITITAAELGRTKSLGETAQIWLKDSSIVVSGNTAKGHPEIRYYSAKIVFTNKRWFGLTGWSTKQNQTNEPNQNPTKE